MQKTGIFCLAMLLGLYGWLFMFPTHIMAGELGELCDVCWHIMDCLVADGTDWLVNTNTSAVSERMHKCAETFPDQDVVNQFFGKYNYFMASDIADNVSPFKICQLTLFTSGGLIDPACQKCPAGFYGKTYCTLCPVPGTSESGARYDTHCYIPDGSDDSGTFRFKNWDKKCYYH